MSVSTNKADQAAQLCQEILAELDKTTDFEERCILLGVLTDNMNKWTLEMKLQEIQRKSREQSGRNEGIGQ